MKKMLKIVALFLVISVFSGCSMFKKGCQCPKFNQQKAPHIAPQYQNTNP